MDFDGKKSERKIKIKPKNNIDIDFHFWYNRKFNQK
jgi:hypothetical protein